MMYMIYLLFLSGKERIDCLVSTSPTTVYKKYMSKLLLENFILQ